MKVTIHHTPSIEWHRERVGSFVLGLREIGIDAITTTRQHRISDAPAVLFGTTNFKAVEAAHGNWLLVDRACWGDPDFVRLGWNGHGALADYRIPRDCHTRWIPVFNQSAPGDRVIVCSDYQNVPPYGDDATHFKPHPADETWNPTDLPTVRNFIDCKRAIVGKSSVAVELMLRGIPIQITDRRSMANLPLDEIAWTQWGWHEIAAGKPIGHLFEWLRNR